MRNLIGTAATILLLATPVMAQTPAGDSEIQSQLAWEQTVAKAQAYHATAKVDPTNSGVSKDTVPSQVGTARTIVSAPNFQPYQDN